MDVKALLPLNMELDNRLLSKLEARSTAKEGPVRIREICHLIADYGYSSRQVDIEVPAGAGRAALGSEVTADIVIYRDFDFKLPLTVIETREPKGAQGLKQAESYARNIGAEFHVWTDGTDRRVAKTGRYGEESQPTGDMPFWATSEPLASKLPKTKKLRPFRDEEELRGVVARCHDIIWEKQGDDPARAFDELTKLLFLKLYDERETPDHYEFMAYAGQAAEDACRSLRKLFREAVKAPRYTDIFYESLANRHDDVIYLDDATLFRVVPLLQPYSLIETVSNVGGADIKGTVYERMVGSTFRGSLGQFFTHRILAEFCVDMIMPSDRDKVLDPSCGSAGFLIMVLKKLRRSIQQSNPNLPDTEIERRIQFFAEHNIFGTDISARMARVAKMNMIMHGDGHSGIFNVNGLVLPDSAPAPARRELRESTFDVIYANPPFAGRESDPDILKQYELGVTTSGRPRKVTREILFIERIIRFLKEGGRAAIVLPQGVFSDRKDRSLRAVREYIRRKCRILAVIELPDWAFVPSGTTVRGSILFIQREEQPPASYPVFMRMVKRIGYTSTGREDGENELAKIVEEFHDPQCPYFVKYEDLEDRIDAKLYAPENLPIIRLFQQNNVHQLKPLKEICEFVQMKPSKQDYHSEGMTYVETGDIDPDTLTLCSRRETRYSGFRKVLPGDILVSRRRPYRAAIVEFPDTYSYGLVIREISILRVRPGYDKHYVLELLRSPEFVRLMTIHSTGEMSGRLGEEDLMALNLPIPKDRRTQSRLGRQLATNRRKSEEARRAEASAVERISETTHAVIYGEIANRGRDI